jgi:uncharacterized protein YidB (DUF937 family)
MRGICTIAISNCDRKEKEKSMGLFEEVIAMAGSSGQQTQHASALTAIMGYINSPQVGGIAGLQQMFQQGGLGHVISSWVSSGQNLPVSASQLQNVLHSGALQQAAQQSGLDPSQLTNMMSTLLPHLVDKLTPNGQVPDASALQQLLKGQAATG